MGLQVLINSAKADVTIALGKTENADVRKAFRQISAAFDNCKTPDDVLWLQGIFWDVRQNAVLYEARARLEAVRRRS